MIIEKFKAIESDLESDRYELACANICILSSQLAQNIVNFILKTLKPELINRNNKIAKERQAQLAKRPKDASLLNDDGSFDSAALNEKSNEKIQAIINSQLLSPKSTLGKLFVFIKATVDKVLQVFDKIFRLIIYYKCI